MPAIQSKSVARRLAIQKGPDPLPVRREIHLLPVLEERNVVLVVIVRLDPNGRTCHHRHFHRRQSSRSLARLLAVIFDAHRHGECHLRPAISCVGYGAYFHT